jgi:hypothetical protein
MPSLLNNFWKYLAEKKVFICREVWFPPLLLALMLLSANLVFAKSIKINVRPSFVISAPQSHYPVGALDWMRKNNLQGNVLPDFDWGEFIMWSCYPYCKVAMDGRYETVYHENLIKEYFVFLEGKEGWNIFLKKYPPDLILIKPFTKIYFLMIKDPSWKAPYIDKQSVLFIRNSNH